jgi:ribonuclease HI
VTRVYKYLYEQFCRSGLEVVFEKVKSHSGDFCNDEADRLAKEAAKKRSNVEWTLRDFESTMKILDQKRR